ncbi:glycoside hydrolase family 76 protein [Aulographum hederae CBS 113979]|uniref:Mannan endo-1,6-alpha-mannosidase n=1 Tax=Aulographum hederae CBS 113979 TaxID=1176131 RepID=A0A6G1H5Z2_9PEZI|nr:glycoside hydrolase family 76 protein [Aulographum hederae CBS 113979]
MRRTILIQLVSFLSFLSFSGAINLDASSDDSTRSAANAIAKDLMSFYNESASNSPPGVFDKKYSWWKSGAAWDTMIDYWYLTDDAQYNSVVQKALKDQAGAAGDFMNPSLVALESNSDQATWGLAALSAAERSFPEPEDSPSPSWVTLAQTVLEQQASRWDASTCSGGLHWQISPLNLGYTYKNSLANGLHFELAARLAAFTGNQTHVEWANAAYWWAWNIGLINQSTYSVYDGADSLLACKNIVPVQWSAPAGAFLYGSATMYSMTKSDLWHNRVIGHLNAINSTFFYPPGHSTNEPVLFEASCEPENVCTGDQSVYKNTLARSMAWTASLMEETADMIHTLLGSTATAVAAGCTGGDTGSICGKSWLLGRWDGTIGFDQELTALSVVQARLVEAKRPLVTANETAEGAGTAGNSEEAEGKIGGSGKMYLSWSAVGVGLVAVIFTVYL